MTAQPDATGNPAEERRREQQGGAAGYDQPADEPARQRNAADGEAAGQHLLHLDGRVDEKRHPPGLAAEIQQPRQHQARLGEEAPNMGERVGVDRLIWTEGRSILQPQPPEIGEMQHGAGRTQSERQDGREMFEQIRPEHGADRPGKGGEQRPQRLGTREIALADVGHDVEVEQIEQAGRPVGPQEHAGDQAGQIGQREQRRRDDQQQHRHRIDPARAEPPDEDRNEQGGDDADPPDGEEQQTHVALAAKDGVGLQRNHGRKRCARHGVECEQTRKDDRAWPDEGPSPGERFGCHFQIFESSETIGRADADPTGETSGYANTLRRSTRLKRRRGKFRLRAEPQRLSSGLHTSTHSSGGHFSHGADGPDANR